MSIVNLDEEILWETKLIPLFKKWSVPVHVQPFPSLDLGSINNCKVKNQRNWRVASRKHSYKLGMGWEDFNFQHLNIRYKLILEELKKSVSTLVKRLVITKPALLSNFEYYKDVVYEKLKLQDHTDDLMNCTQEGHHLMGSNSNKILIELLNNEEFYEKLQSQYSYLIPVVVLRKRNITHYSNIKKRLLSKYFSTLCAIIILLNLSYAAN